MYQIILKSGQIMYTNVLEFISEIQKRKESGEYGIVTHELGLTLDTSQVAGVYPLPNTTQS